VSGARSEPMKVAHGRLWSEEKVNEGAIEAVPQWCVGRNVDPSHPIVAVMEVRHGLTPVSMANHHRVTSTEDIGQKLCRLGRN
jgi:hypothetical protein